jgi:predicted ATPase
VTLTGVGGTGKTRLALQVAADALPAYPDGARLVELAALRDPGLVPQAVATPLGVREEGSRPLPATLTDALRPRRLLLVLDNCEHLLDACARLADAVLRACPRLTVLATSREALGLAGETVWRVPSLALPAVPADQSSLPVETLARCEAVAPFVDRARAVRPRFAVTPESAPAVVHLEAALAHYAPAQHQEHVRLVGPDRGLAALIWSCWAAWLRGYPDQARERSRRALALAHELKHPFTLAWAHCFAAGLQTLLRDAPAAQEQAEAAAALARAQAQPAAMAGILGGWARAVQGRPAEGLAEILESLDAWRAIGSQCQQTWFLSLLADACLQDDRVEEGLAALAEGLTAVQATGENYYAAELHRLRSEALLRRTPPASAAAAETSFREALEVARQQEARSIELRAAVSLSRLWQRQGKREAAHAVLAGIHGWFTEGFDTADLREAKPLLAELDGSG